MMKKELQKKSRKKNKKSFSFYPTKKIFIYLIYSFSKDNK